MSGRYILAIDQSTQSTKGFLFDADGAIVARADRAHRQIVDVNGWVEHDPREILENTLSVCTDIIVKNRANADEIVAVGISNQRETVVVWDSKTGKPLNNAIVWQCSRAMDICEELCDLADKVKMSTGLNLSPFFTAPKLTWLMRNVPSVKEALQKGTLCCGTVDSWLVFNLTKEKAFKTDYSNASRTALFNIHSLEWDEDLCRAFSVPRENLPQVCMSDSVFGHTDLGGLLSKPVKICGVLGDSHAALLAQNCREPGQIKATYGTGSSVMMNTGSTPINSNSGLVTSLAWGLGGKVEYVLEGNLNYTGAVISWLKNDLKLISTDAESEELAREANQYDKTYFIPSFSGLGAPYWDSKATGLFSGITRTTGKAEMVRACVQCIGYQIADLIELMRQDSGMDICEIKADGGPTANKYLMQFQSDIAKVRMSVPYVSELSAVGAAFAAGFGTGFYDSERIYKHFGYRAFTRAMSCERRQELFQGWKQAIRQVLTH